MYPNEDIHSQRPALLRCVTAKRVKYHPSRRKVNQTAHTANLKKKEFRVYWFIYQHHLSLQGSAGRKAISHIFKQ